MPIIIYGIGNPVSRKHRGCDACLIAVEIRRCVAAFVRQSIRIREQVWRNEFCALQCL